MSATNSSVIERTLIGLVISAGFLAAFLDAATSRAQGAPPPSSAAPSPALPPASSSPAPGSAPPPYMYQEPWSPPPGEPQRPGGAPPSGQSPAPSPPVYRGSAPPYPPPPYPGPYVYEPPPPPALYHRAPMSSLWVGGRVGAMFPFGNAYDLGYDLYGYPIGESWEGLASSGLDLEGDVGVRIARRYIVYGFWEHGFMGTGGDPSWNSATATHLAGVSAFGEQSSASTDFTGAGFRWSSRPDASGIVVDLGLGYRWFRESWANGASMALRGFGEFRVGFGADLRVNRTFSLSPLFMFSTGSFHDRQVTLAGQPTQSIASYAGTHGTVTLTLGGHFDLASSY